MTATSTSPLLSCLFHDETFGPEIKGYFRKFQEVAEKTIQEHLSNENIRPYMIEKMKGRAETFPSSSNIPSRSNTFNMQSIYFTALDGIGITVEKRELIQREKKIYAALWVILLECFRQHVSNDDLKYPTLESFLQVYKSYGDNISTISQESETEKRNLWQTANWMIVLLSMVPPKKSKDLAIQVIPKLIEGWEGQFTIIFLMQILK